jgi:parvulin-like peptidyl-prolyl isomerase
MNARNNLPRPRRPSFITATAAFLLAGACSQSAAAADVVARVGGTDVTSDELKAYVETLGAQEQAALAKDPAKLSQVVRSYLAQRAVLKEAQTRKWDQDPAVKAQLDRVREQALAELYLQSVSRPPDGYPSEAEVEAAYDANKGAFEVPRQYRLAQIFIAAPRGTDKDAEAKARERFDEVVKKLKKGGDFAAIARTDSDDKEATAKGGEIGWLAESQIVASIRTAVTSLSKGAVSDPLRLDDGWHVVKLLDIKAPSTRPLAEVREALAAQLRTEKAKANRQAYLAKLLEDNPPAINELALTKVVAKAK